MKLTFTSRCVYETRLRPDSGDAERGSPSQLPALCFPRKLWSSALTTGTHTPPSSRFPPRNESCCNSSLQSHRWVSIFLLLPPAHCASLSAYWHLHSFHTLAWNQHASLFLVIKLGYFTIFLNAIRDIKESWFSTSPKAYDCPSLTCLSPLTPCFKTSDPVCWILQFLADETSGGRLWRLYLSSFGSCFLYFHGDVVEGLAQCKMSSHGRTVLSSLTSRVKMKNFWEHTRRNVRHVRC